MKRLFVVFLIALFPLSVSAKDEFSLNCDKTEKVNINDEIICRVTANSDFVYDKISFTLLNMDGLGIVDVRSNYEKQWSIKRENDKVEVLSNELHSDLQEFGIILIKALKDGHQDLALDNVVLENTKDNTTRVLEAVKETIKIVSSDNLLKSIKINGNDINGFDSKKVRYNLNINDESSIKIEAESNNEYATVKGTGEFKLSEKQSTFIFPLTVLSEDGISKIYVLHVQRDNFEVNSTNKRLESLNIKNDKGNTLIINFNPELYEYNFGVDMSTKYLEIKPILENSDSKFVKGYGEQKLELKSGNNIAVVKIQDEDGDVLNYVLNITKPIANKSANNYIKALLVKNYKLDFSKRVKNYTLEINPNDKSLDITPVLESSTARYTIIDNNNLKNGSVIKIEVVAENEERAIYKINIKIKKNNYLNYFLYLIIILGGVGLLYKLSSKLKKKMKSSKVNSSKKTKKPVQVSSKKVSSKTASKSKSSSKKNNKSSAKKVTNSKSTRNPRNNYTKKKPATKKKTSKQVGSKKKSAKKK